MLDPKLRHFRKTIFWIFYKKHVGKYMLDVFETNETARIIHMYCKVENDGNFSSKNVNVIGQLD